MTPFTNFESRMVPLAMNNVDTDQIIPGALPEDHLQAGPRQAALQ